MPGEETRREMRARQRSGGPGRLCRRAATALALCSVTAGCRSLVKVDVDVIDEKTLLERQVLGQYEALAQDVVLAASVRSVDPDGRLVRRELPPPAKAEVLDAMRVREYNRDDIDALREAQLAGEGQDGLVALFEDRLAGQALWNPELVRNVIAEENAARRLLMRWIIETSEVFTAADLPRVERIAAAIEQERARPGDLIQAEDGQWMRKGEAQ